MESACVLDETITSFGRNSVLVGRSEGGNRIGDGPLDDELELLAGCHTWTVDEVELNDKVVAISRHLSI